MLINKKFMQKAVALAVVTLAVSVFANASQYHAASAQIIDAGSVKYFSRVATDPPAPPPPPPAPSTYTVHRSPIQPGALPKPPANSSTISTALSIVFGVIGALALLMITVAGLKYITAGGDPQQASEAKRGIVYALVGLAIAVAAESIVVFLVNNV